MQYQSSFQETLECACSNSSHLLANDVFVHLSIKATYLASLKLIEVLLEAFNCRVLFSLWTCFSFLLKCTATICYVMKNSFTLRGLLVSIPRWLAWCPTSKNLVFEIGSRLMPIVVCLSLRLSLSIVNYRISCYRKLAFCKSFAKNELFSKLLGNSVFFRCKPD